MRHLFLLCVFICISLNVVFAQHSLDKLLDQGTPTNRQQSKVESSAMEKADSADAELVDRIGKTAAALRPSTTGGPSIKGGRAWRCLVQCRGPLYKLGSRPSLGSFGNKQWEARENVQDQANRVCSREKGISWAEVMDCK